MGTQISCRRLDGTYVGWFLSYLEGSRDQPETARLVDHKCDVVTPVALRPFPTRKTFLTLRRIAPTYPLSCLPLVKSESPAYRAAQPWPSVNVTLERVSGANGFDTGCDAGRAALRRWCRPDRSEGPLHRSRTSAGKSRARELSA